MNSNKQPDVLQDFEGTGDLRNRKRQLCKKQRSKF